jgi:trehalose 6-phosphate phosphatase
MPADTSIERSLEVLETRPSGMFFDIDGTLSEIAGRPEEARVGAMVRERLREIVGLIDVVGVISGRSVDDARDMLRLDEIVYSGNHGMERWSNGRHAVSDDAARYVDRIATITDQLRDLLDIPGVLVENKRLTASVHFREAPDPARAESAILSLLEPLLSQSGLRLTHGRMVVEIRPPVERDKGTSIRDIIDDYGLTSAIYVGDDVTDVDAFRALRAWRESTGNLALAIGVTGDETPEEVLEAADVTVDGVRGVVTLLDGLRERLSG